MSVLKEPIWKRQLPNLGIALNALIANRFRSMLTALGIIFGVAAVIAMMAIGKGTKQEILDQMKQVGVNNIVVLPILEDDDDFSVDDESANQKEAAESSFSPGLTMADALAIQSVVPSVKAVNPEINFETTLVKDGIVKAATLSGISPSFFEIFNQKIYKGKIFTTDHIEHSKAVCIISYDIESRFFTHEEAIGKYIKCDQIWYQVVGVLQPDQEVSKSNIEMGISNNRNTVYVPIQTLLLRYKNRSLINARIIAESQDAEEGDEKKNWNQLDKIVVQVHSTEQLRSTSEIIHRLLMRRHAGVEDFEVNIPQLLLKQQERTKDVFSIVLIAIASISLLVGGIGIMNIMLASVMERTNEIGIRRAMGATQKDISIQFISEATLISISGGILGILLGFTLSYFLSHLSLFIPDFKDIPAENSILSVVISFTVSVSVGILFGYIPAKRAAEKDPVTSLRHE
ncbi:MAG: FtsX-like permease family protein [Bacteroidetes bacterium]|nr:FtsX-like permease family protein [Bacteroidota bacterium]